MTILVFWLLFAVGVGVFASNRGRSGVGWFLLSVLLSPLLGLLFVAVSKDLSRDLIQPRSAGSSGQVACPSCAEWVQPAAKLCKHCGTALIPTDTRQADAHRQALEKDANATIQLIMGIVGVVVLVFLAVALLS